MSVIEKRGSVRSDRSPCWTHRTSPTSSGYGQICFQYNRIDLHRYSYYIHNGCPTLTSKDHVRHLCNNKECSNPEHLTLGNAKSNSDDYWASPQAPEKKVKEKKRNIEPCLNCIENHKKCSGEDICLYCKKNKKDCVKKEYTPSPGAWNTGDCVGEKNKNAVLNWEKVREIRRRHEQGLKYGELKKMAEEYEIAYITIQKIVGNKLWIEETHQVSEASRTILYSQPKVGVQGTC